MRGEKERPFEERRKEIEERRKEMKEKYFVEKIQSACNIIKRIGKDPDEQSDLVIAVFNKFVECDSIDLLTEILGEIRDKL
jgi:hypothetical protein